MLFKNKKPTREEFTKVLIDKSIEILINQLPEKTFPSGIIRPYFVAFDVPKTKNEAFLRVERSADGVCLQVHAVRQGTNRSWSHFMHSCSDAELENYLKNHIDREAIYKSVIELSESADEYWS